MTITAELPDGRKLEFPDGTDAAVVRQTVQRMVGGPPPAALPAAPVQPISREATTAERISADPFVGFAAGAAEPAFGISQLQDRAAKALGWENNPYGYLARSGEEFQKMRKTGLADRGDIGLDVPRLMGNVMTPVGLVAGKALPAATTALGRMGQASGMGAGFGATSLIDKPEENYLDKLTTNIGIGTAAGGLLSGAVSLGGKVGKAAYHGLIEPLTKKGVEAVKGREFGLAAGEQKDRLVQALLHPREIVPGSKPHTGEVSAEVGAPVMANLQKQASDAMPGIYNLREIGQNQARHAELQSFGKTPTERAAAMADVDAASRAAYGAVEKDLVKVTPELQAVLDAPASKSAMRAVTEKAGNTFQARPGGKEKFFDQPKPWTVENLQRLRSELDAAAKQKNISPDEARTIGGVRDRLTDIMKDASPGWDIARQQHAAQMRPVNQMDIGQHLEAGLGDRVATYGANVPQNVKSYTKSLEKLPKELQPYGPAERLLSPGQLEKAENVAADLARKAEYERLAKKGAAAAPDLYGFAAKQLERETGGSSGPNILHRAAMIANTVVKRIQGRANERIALEMAKDMLEPPEVARLIMQADTPSKRKALVDAIVQSGGFRAGKAALPPALINQEME